MSSNNDEFGFGNGTEWGSPEQLGDPSLLQSVELEEQRSEGATEQHGNPHATSGVAADDEELADEPKKKGLNKLMVYGGLAVGAVVVAGALSILFPRGGRAPAQVASLDETRPVLPAKGLPGLQSGSAGDMDAQGLPVATSAPASNVLSEQSAPQNADSTQRTQESVEAKPSTEAELTRLKAELETAKAEASQAKDELARARSDQAQRVTTQTPSSHATKKHVAARGLNKKQIPAGVSSGKAATSPATKAALSPGEEMVEDRQREARVVLRAVLPGTHRDHVVLESDGRLANIGTGEEAFGVKVLAIDVDRREVKTDRGTFQLR
jgi:hypothetical protein